MAEGTSPLIPAGDVSGADALRRFFRVAPAGERVEDWHVGPAVDLAAYHFSWLWMLLPLLALGDAHPIDYAPLLALTLVLGFVHRHVTLPGVYLDRQVFRRHPLRFTLAPAGLVVALVASPAILREGLPAGSIGGWPAQRIPGPVLIGAVVFVAGAWNVWHVHMQKYGILRLYDAKRAGPAVPGWVDRLLVLGWVPLVVTHLGTRHADVALEQLSAARAYLAPVAGFLATWEPVLVPVAAACAAASAVIFFATEWHRHRWRHAPRLGMGIGTALLLASFLVFDPIKVYIAFGFSHAVEYLVFVWAFQRRRYAGPSPAPPLLARILARAAWALPLFGMSLAAVYVLTKRWSPYGFEVWGLTDVVVLGTQLALWMRLWGVYQSLLHFYYDGFLWKARDERFRSSI